MSSTNHRPVRVLYSFPHKLGADRICYTAWQQVLGIVAAGADVTVFTGALHRPVPAGVKVKTSLALGKLRIPYRLLGRMGACVLHDKIVARHVRRSAGKYDVIHVWPLGGLETIKAAAKAGIPTVMERPNAHTRFAYEVVQQECMKLGLSMPPGHEHAYDTAVLSREEAEYDLADRLLCPSDFVARTFAERGYPVAKLARHQYGFDEGKFNATGESRKPGRGLTMLFAGGCAPRKGLHYALDAWLQSPASKDGTFMIAGGFIPGYAELLAKQLAHASVKVLGHRKDLPDLMRQSDILVLPSIEEGSALVTSEGRGCGCVLLVSDAAGAICRHEENALMHAAGDAKTLARHITMLNDDRELLARLRASSLATIKDITWSAAGKRLVDVYQETLEQLRKSAAKAGASARTTTSVRQPSPEPSLP